MDVPWYSKYTSIKTVKISLGVTSIGDDAFYNCTGLSSITIPDSVTSIGEYALGYYYNNAFDDTAVDSFTIYGHTGTVAEKYAQSNGFDFVAEAEELPEEDEIEEASDHSGSISVVAIVIIVVVAAATIVVISIKKKK